MGDSCEVLDYLYTSLSCVLHFLISAAVNGEVRPGLGSVGRQGRQLALWASSWLSATSSAGSPRPDNLVEEGSRSEPGPRMELSAPTGLTLAAVVVL